MDADGFTLVTRKNKHRKKKNYNSAAHLAGTAATSPSSPGSRGKRKAAAVPAAASTAPAAAADERSGFSYHSIAAGRSKQSRRRRRQRGRDGAGGAGTDTRHAALLSKFLKLRRIISSSPLPQAVRELLVPRLLRCSSSSGGPLNVHLTAYGVGNFDGNSSGCFQLAFADVMRREVLEAALDRTAAAPTAPGGMTGPASQGTATALSDGVSVKTPSSSAPDSAQRRPAGGAAAAAAAAAAVPRVRLLFFDPMTTQDEAAFLAEHLNVEVLAAGNDRGRRPLGASAGLHVVFMPHCERWLYENFLTAHAADAEGGARPPLSRVVLVGNSFKVFQHQSPHDPQLRRPHAAAAKGEQQQEGGHEEKEQAGVPARVAGDKTAESQGRPAYLQGHRETALPVAVGDPYWTALSGLVVHEWELGES